jgi:hypothetical protein
MSSSVLRRATRVPVPFDFGESAEHRLRRILGVFVTAWISA